MVFHTITWIDSNQDALFLVEESHSLVRIHWITHPFVVGQLVSKNFATPVAKGTNQTYTGQQVLNMIVNVPLQDFSRIEPPKHS
jgi:hypothetical protein|tara:strand:+ start:2701 stop:2952 length:252 start_codon:yes stop_codon:yes gene_type:complete